MNEIDPKPKPKPKVVEPVIDFSGLTAGQQQIDSSTPEPDFSGLMPDEPPDGAATRGAFDNLHPERLGSPLDIEIIQREGRERFLKAVESQRKIVDINSDLQRRGINPLDFHSKDLHELKKTVDPLYEKTGVFIPLPVSFEIDETTGKAGNIVQDPVLSENTWGNTAKRTFAFAAEGVKGLPHALVSAVNSPFVAAKYHMALPMLDKMGAFDKDKSGLFKVLDKLNLPNIGLAGATEEDWEHFKDMPIEEKNAMLDEAAINMALIAVDLFTQGAAAPFFAKKALGKGTYSTIKNLESVPVADRAAYLTELAKTAPGQVERVAKSPLTAIAGADVKAAAAGGFVAGAAYPLIDKSDETGFGTALAFGIVGGLLGRSFGAKHAFTKDFTKEADIIATAAQVSNLRNLNIAAQSSAAQVYRTVASLVDNDLSVEATIAELAKDKDGFTVIPIANQEAYNALDKRITAKDNVGLKYHPTFKLNGEAKSILIRGSDVSDQVWESVHQFFIRTGLVPNELVSIGGQIAMKLEQVALPKAGVQSLKRPVGGIVMRDPVTGRIAVVPDYAIRRVAGEPTGISLIDDAQATEIAQDFVNWSVASDLSEVNELTPVMEIANREVYPNTPRAIQEFIEGEGGSVNITGEETILPDKTRVKAFKRDPANPEGSVNKFQLTGIYKELTPVDFLKLSQALVSRDMSHAAGFIDYITRAIAIKWKNTSFNGVSMGPEATLGHEVYHPIANGIVANFPTIAKAFFDKAVKGEGVHPLTHEYAKMLGAVETIKTGGGSADIFFHWRNEYPTWESRWEEAITEELGIRAVQSGALTTARTANYTIDELVDRYMDVKEIAGESKAGIKSIINNKIAQAMYDRLLGSEARAMITEFKDATIGRIRTQDARDLSSEASSMGFYLDDAGSGRIHIRDIYSEEIISTFDNTQQAREFLNNSTQPASKALDVDPSLEMVPEAARGLGGGVMPPSGPVGRSTNADHSTPYPFHKPGWFEKFNAFFNSSNPWFTSMRDYMIALDNVFKTELYEKVYRPTQDAAAKNNEARVGWLKRLSEIEGNILGLNSEQRKLISSYRETMTPDEVIRSFMHRRLSDVEIKYAQQIRDMDVDLQKVFNYLRRVEELKDQIGQVGKVDLSGDAIGGVGEIIEAKKGELKRTIEELNKSMGMDDSHLAVAGLFNQIKTLDPDAVSLGAVVRLARSYGKHDTGPELTRAEFAKKNGMTPAQVRTATELDKMYNDLAEVFEIDDYRRLNAYMNHYRLYNELPEETAQFLRRLQKGARRINDKEFVSQLMRTGELGLFETDPIRAALSYINAGFSNINLHPTLRAAEAEIAKQLGNVTNRRGKHALTVLTRYLDELRGIPSMSVEQTQANFEAFLKGINQNQDVNFRNNLVNMYLAVSNTATMGFRPALALRDLASWYTAFGSRFGILRATNGLRLAMKPGVTEYLRSKGVLPTIDIVEFLSPAEYESSGLSNAGNKLPSYLRTVAKAGMTASGQRYMFELIHTAAYLEVDNLLLGSKDKPGLLLRLQRGELTRDKVYKKAFLNSYDIPVAEAFDRLVIQGRMEEAAHFLAKATSEETGFVYNQANHPHGWETNIGRIAGQYGTWPVWMSRYLTRMASRGTRRELFGVYSRFAMLQGAIKGAEIATGFNFYSWYLSPNFGYAGGPMVHAVVALGELLSSSNDNVKQQRTRDLLQLLPFVRNLKLKELAKINPMDPRPFNIDNAIDWRWDKPGSIFLPGSFALQDWVSAFQLYDSGYNPVTSLGKGFGFAVDKKRRSTLDNVLGYYHPFEY
jgi:hypothetical protein